MRLRMKKWVALLGAMAVFVGGVPVTAQADNPENSQEFDGHYYAVFNDAMTWTKAKKACESLGGHLVTITSAKEQQFVKSICYAQGKQYYYWIGGYQQKNAWKWVTGEKWDYTYWEEKQPDQSGGGGYCLIQAYPNIEFPFIWEDQNNTGITPNPVRKGEPYCQTTEHYGYVCEWDKMPQKINAVDQAMEKTKKDKDLPMSRFEFLQLKAGKATASSLQLTWKKVTNADGYMVYGNRCGKKYFYQFTLSNPNETHYTMRNLKPGTHYKYVVVAYKMVGYEKVIATISKTIHATTKGGKFGNVKKVAVKKKKVRLKAKKSAKIHATAVRAGAPYQLHRKLKYESSDTKVAKVTQTGKIVAKSKGKCKIYVYAQNGVSKAVSVVVK